MKNRVNELDLLRFLAALSVMFFHYGFRGYAADGMSDVPFPALAGVVKYGYLGVELFFLISGFVILMSAKSGSLWKFFVSRVVRLYPAFWVCCTLTFIAILILDDGRFSASMSQYLMNMTMVNGLLRHSAPHIDGAYWSLVVEMRFYILISLVILFGQMKRIEFLLVVWLVITILMESIFSNYFPMWRQYLVIDFSAWFAGGAMCYLIRERGLSIFRLGAVAVAWGIAIFQSLGQIKTFDEHYHAHSDVMVIIVAITVFFLVMLLIAIGRTGFFANRRWTMLGALTYPLYLIHQNIGFMLLNRFGSSVNHYVLLICAMLGMLLLAYGIHKFIEKPVAALVKRIIMILYASSCMLLHRIKARLLAIIN